MNALNTIISTGCEQPTAKQCESPSLLETLKRREQELSSRLHDVTLAIEAMEKNPEVSKVIELIARTR